MSLAEVRSCVRSGVSGQPVGVQAHLASGLPRVAILGSTDVAVNEARDRVRSAIVNSGFTWPDARITVSLAPATTSKRGAGLDVAVAIAVLVADEQIEPVGDAILVGELGLDGSIRSVPGAIAMSHGLDRDSPGTVFVPAADAGVWAWSRSRRVVPVTSLTELVDWLRRPERQVEAPRRRLCEEPSPVGADMSDVVGQPAAVRAALTAAAGRHHILFTGPPGVGKSMLAHRLAGLLPALSPDEALESAAVAEACGDEVRLSTRVPFQTPHHSASHVAMVGSARGTEVQPGLISRSHRGVLVLDEAPEFRRETLESLRQPLESGSITVARAGVTAQLPACFQLVATANPCPCGQHGARDGDCRCPALSVQRYEARLSAPLLDRIDINLRLDRPRSTQPAPPTTELAERVVRARECARERWPQLASTMTPCGPGDPATLPEAVRTFLEQERWRRRGGGERRHAAAVRLTWTLAALDGCESPSLEHASDALRLRG